MRRRTRHGSGALGLAVALALLLAPATAPAQSVGGPESTGPSVGGRAAIELYSFSDDAAVGVETITLVTAPFGARTTLARNLRIELFGNFARGALTPAGGEEVTLSGLTDTDIQVDYTLGGDAVTLTGVLSLPTGSSTLDREEAAVAGFVAADLLPFRISNWGSGGGVTLQAAGARRFDDFGAGLSVSYRVAGDFEPVEAGDFTYEPGDELRVKLALDTEIGSGGKGSLLVRLRSFSDDARDGATVFETGTRIDVTGSYAFPLGYRRAGVVYGGVIHREEGNALSAPFTDSPAQDLVLLGGHLRIPWGDTRVRPRVDARIFRSDDGVGQGFVTGVGASLEIPGEGITWAPTLTGRIGNVEVAEGRESFFLGFEAGLSVRFGR